MKHCGQDVTKIEAKDARVGTTLVLDGSTYIVQKVTSTKASVILDVEGYFASWHAGHRANNRQKVYRKTDLLDSIPHPGLWN